MPSGFIVWTEPISDRLDAPVTGIVTIAQDGCVSLHSEPDGPLEPAIWPYGTTFDGTVIRTVDGVEIRSGDWIVGGGGEVEYADDYFIENTTLARDLDVMLDCWEDDDDRITALNPTQSIATVPE
ncbi:MAG: hypothetical protein ACE37B_07930 [Ilumatobacter sp.]|uniref:hypothetical protein n=1 Tax=Ilumatobacter sp. TaxID=1967498 RepID=UPI00391D1DEF